MSLDSKIHMIVITIHK